MTFSVSKWPRPVTPPAVRVEVLIQDLKPTGWSVDARIVLPDIVYTVKGDCPDMIKTRSEAEAYGYRQVLDEAMQVIADMRKMVDEARELLQTRTDAERNRRP